MDSPSFFRHRKLTIEKTKKGQNREKKSLNSAPKSRVTRFISHPNGRFLGLHLFIPTLLPFFKNREKRRKSKKNRGNPRFFRPHLFSADYLVAEVGFEPHDLRVMSPTSYQAALLRDSIPTFAPKLPAVPFRAPSVPSRADRISAPLLLFRALAVSSLTSFCLFPLVPVVPVTGIEPVRYFRITGF